MNRHYISRFVLMIVLLLGVCAKGWADGETVIFSEDFENLPWSGNLVSYKNWVLSYCGTSNRLDENENATNKYSLKVGTATEIGTAITPSINNMPKAAELLIYYANGHNSGTGSFTVKLSSGIFSESGNKSVTIATPNNQKQQTRTLHILGAEEEITISFIKVNPGNPFALSGVYVNPLPSVTLSSSESNATTLSDNAGKLANVTLDRTFPANTWCTLCLPFEVTASSIGTACGTDAPRLRVFSGVEGNTMKFTEPTGGAVSAGTPFLLKFTTAVTSNPVFNSVTISNTPAATVTSGGCSFIGTYSPVSIGSTDCFLNSDGQLCHPKNDGNTNYNVLPGLRAYFTLPTTTSGARPVVSIADDNATTVGTAASVAPSVEAIYTLGGLPVASPKSPGIYLVRRTDGSTQKVTIR